ncbi:MAG: response regulator transcription factor [Halieaceae bacterium]|jgi:two-component system, OmpR family, response regulator RstA|nr:response regulator transcription factor [Halieaceae bacterium]
MPPLTLANQVNEHIVLVDDDADLTRMVGRFLERQGFSVDILRTGEGAGEKILRINPDLVILDLMLPGVSGMAICRSLRPNYGGPVLMLTALGEDADQIAGLNQGADDYLPKPVKPELLLAHIQALLRRHSAPEEESARDNIQRQSLLLEPSQHRASWDGTELQLSAREFNLLCYMARHCGEILSRDRLYRAIYERDYDGQDRSLDLMMSRLRRKVPYGERSIRTLRGQGYLLALENE